MRYYYFNKNYMTKLDWKYRTKYSSGEINRSLTNLIYLRVEACCKGGIIETLLS